MTARRLAVYANGRTPARLELRSWDGTIIRTMHTAPARRLHEHTARAARARRAARPRHLRGIHPATHARWVRYAQADAAARDDFNRNTIAIRPLT